MGRGGVAVLMLLATAGAVFGEPGAGDPTRPPEQFVEGRDAVHEPSLRLTSIWIGSERRVVVIDGRALEEGDLVGGHEIVAIEPSRVRLRDGDRTFEIRIFGPQERRP